MPCEICEKSLTKGIKNECGCSYNNNITNDMVKTVNKNVFFKNDSCLYGKNSSEYFEFCHCKDCDERYKKHVSYSKNWV